MQNVEYVPVPSDAIYGAFQVPVPECPECR